MTTLQGDQIVAGDHGNGNRIVGTPRASPGSKVEFDAANGVVTFAKGSSLAGTISLRRDDAVVGLGRRSSFRGRMSLGLGCEITIGDDVYCGVAAYLTTAEGTSIRLGDDLLIGDRFQARADDSHPLYDGLTGERINHSRSIVVEDHVWIGADVILLPGSRVGEGSVVGIRSMVTKSRPVPPHTLVVGSPVEVQRRDVHWVRKHLQHSTDVAATIEPGLWSREVSRESPRGSGRGAARRWWRSGADRRPPRR